MRYAHPPVTIDITDTPTGADVQISVTPTPPIVGPFTVAGPLTLWGDSITAGTAASSAATAYPGLVAAVKGTTTANHGVSGAQAADLASAVYQERVATSRAYVYATGVNDGRVSGADTTRQRTMADTQIAQVAWLSLLDGEKVRGLSGATSGGGWGPTAVFGLGQRSTAPGDAIAFTVTGSLVYLALIQQDGVTSQADLVIDGVAIARLSCAAYQGALIRTAVFGTVYAPKLVRLSGLGPGAHTVQLVTVVAGGVSNPFYVDWIAGLSGMPSNNRPFVFVGNCIRSTNYGAGGSDAAGALVNAYLSANVRALAADGLNVRLVDLASVINPATDLASDGIHPSDQGHAKIAQAYEAAMADLVFGS